MNAYLFTDGSHQRRWLLVATLCVAAAGCSEPTTQEQVADGVVLSSNNGTTSEDQGGSHMTRVALPSIQPNLQISLPRDQSSFPPGPDLGAVDTLVCNSCHTPTDIAKFTAPPGPRVKLVNDQCRHCHSADYTSSQPVMTRAAWQKVVVKMADKFGAEEIKLVENGVVKDHPHQALMLDYITAVYGKP